MKRSQPPAPVRKGKSPAKAHAEAPAEISAKPVAAARALSPVTTLAVKIDRCAFLIEREREAKPWRDELSRLKTEFQELAANKAAHLPTRFEGLEYYLDLSPREIKREITNKPKAFAALKKALGLDKLILGLSFSFKMLDAAVAPNDQTSYVKSERTGSRDITAGLLNPPDVPPAA